jgi:hypothetical protein
MHANSTTKQVDVFMKKLLILSVTLATLSLGACSRRSNCPAYGSLQKPVSSATQART